MRRPHLSSPTVITACFAIVLAASLLLYLDVFRADSHVGATNIVPHVVTVRLPTRIVPKRFNGPWAVREGSKVSYRARENHRSGTTTAGQIVGGTEHVSGGGILSESHGIARVSSLGIDFEPLSLRSNEPQFDRALLTSGIESEHFPVVGLKFLSPLSFPANATRGRVEHLQVRCRFTIHAVAKVLRIPVQISFADSEFVLSTSLTAPWERYQMRPPSIAGAAVGDPTFAFHLRFAPSLS